ncbi:purine nucleoside permease [Acetobacteraceae bacterium]|nr:purine nucleoside permease [Acetobacteraceae bacterium]
MTKTFFWKNRKLKTLLLSGVLATFPFFTLPSNESQAAQAKTVKVQQQRKIPVRVVVLTAFEIGKDSGDQAGELQNWVENYPLDKKIEAKDSYRGHYFYNEKDHVLALLMGEGHTSVAQSLTALLKDSRFDFSKSYFVLAGIAGGDPYKISLGSVALARYVVNGGMSHMIDPRDMPEGWQDPYLPVQSSEPYPIPRPEAHSQSGEMVYALNPSLVEWAFEKTSQLALSDNPRLEEARRAYPSYPAAQKAPQVTLGDVISSEIFWAGPHSNAWAERWVDYWTDGKGWLATTAMEDLAVPLVLEREAKQGLVDPNRLLIFRSVSNFDLPPDGKKTADMFKQGEDENDGYVGLEASVNNVYSVASVVVRELSEHWETYKMALPSTESHSNLQK